jgi:hypothetical protein
MRRGSTLHRRVVEEGSWPRVTPSSGVALATYLLVAFAYLGIPVVAHPGRDVIGKGPDPSVLIWSLAWWPHAILHWQNPIFTHTIWAPVGLNLAWAPSVPGLALLTAPATLIAGPTFSYNLLAVSLPALAAWSAYRLCRYLTGSFWPSLAGGYVFGFSAYEFGQTEGHMQVTAIFLVPLAALVVLRFIDGSFSRQRTALTLGVLLALQLSFSFEVALTLTVTLVGAILVGFAVVPTVRGRLRELVMPTIGAYAIAGVLASPLLTYFFLYFEPRGVNTPSAFPADLANLVVPTDLTWASWRWTDAIASRFLGNSAENGAYLGLPCVAVVVWWVWVKRHVSAARFLAIMLALGIVVELGFSLHVAGRAYLPLPWSIVGRLPALNSMLPVRYSMFVSLGAAVAVASWSASAAPRRVVRVALTTLAAAAIAPNVGGHFWHEDPARPSFFTSGIYKSCLTPDENVLMLPNPMWSGAMLWQAESGFYFRLADAYISTVPRALRDYALAHELAAREVPRTGWRPLVKLANDQGATMILVPGIDRARWIPLLAPVATPTEVGDVYLYSLRPGRSLALRC